MINSSNKKQTKVIINEYHNCGIRTAKIYVLNMIVES